MILADTNFWIALSLSKHVFHRAAGDWFAGQSSQKSVLFCRATQQSFLRLITQEAAMRGYDIPAMTNAEAWGLYEFWLADSRVAWIAEPRANLVDGLWKTFACRRTASQKLWMDAYLAAFALAGNHQLVTTDRAFTQFKGLDCIILGNPAAS